MEQTNNDCGEIGTLNFLFGLPTNKFCIIDSDEDSNEEDEDCEDKDCCKLCLNVCCPDDMCHHGIGSGRCCVCQECYDEMEKEDEDDEESSVCEDCGTRCEALDDRFCHSCFHNSDPANCWCVLTNLKKPKLEDVIKAIKNDKTDYSYLFK
jgi:hypothetical protein